MIEGAICSFLDGFLREATDPITDCIVTPFPDREGIPIRIFIRQRNNQFYLFHEKERIIREEQVGRGMPEDRKEDFRRVLRRFDVYYINGEITTGATAESLPARFRNLLQALITLDAMFC
ncbi:MAG TPA: DUF1828 domain-containing protein [Methanoregulaceae archaeon]|nr:DUF1828 domain-containing protein [Methanoregulaceae archaeon]HPD76295.1 DUF1828 domain-containing protein [Methanoregulaceae archaeon]HRY75926.1 DUF1828 domain-containing protein [Methanoregulaceae archaeon]